jgi:hypothetical protein
LRNYDCGIESCHLPVSTRRADEPGLILLPDTRACFALQFTAARLRLLKLCGTAGRTAFCFRVDVAERSVTSDAARAALFE